MTKEDRVELLRQLVDEITKENYDDAMVRDYMLRLGIPYCEDPMQLLNNVLKGIHVIEVPSHGEMV
jgi:hypothetical protein